MGEALEIRPYETAGQGAAVDAERFQELVDEAVASLPAEIAARLDNVDVEVERAPSRALLERMGIGRGGTLLGLYHGVPQTRRTHAYGAVLPDRVVIYRRPVLRAAAEEAAEGDDLEEAVREAVRRKVLHEIGHHFGLDEADLDRLGY